VRHGETELNARGLRCGGDLDVPLSDTGREQVRRLGARIARMDLGLQLILTSSLVRTRETAAILADMLGGLPVEVAEGLEERRLGAWNRVPVADTEDLLRQGVTPPGGEPAEDFRLRIETALAGLVPRLERPCLVVGSRGVARVLNELQGGKGRLDAGNSELLEFSFR
jgi:probable phosphoglycerate mutase